MKKLTLLVVLMAIIMMGCSSPLTKIYSSYVIVDSPQNNAVTTVNIGETMLKKANLHKVEGIELLESATVDKFGIHFIVPPGFVPIDGESDKLWVYDNGPNPYYIYLAVDKQSNKLGYIHIAATDILQTLTNTPKFKKTYEMQFKERSFQQELIYSGKSGNSIKMVYREFKKELIRDAFTQELQYDLSESDIVGFREVRLQIIKATNATVSYKVLKSFDSHAY